MEGKLVYGPGVDSLLLRFKNADSVVVTPVMSLQLAGG